jgi:hypothetical protein
VTGPALDSALNADVRIDLNVLNCSRRLSRRICPADRSINELMLFRPLDCNLCKLESRLGRDTRSFVSAKTDEPDSVQTSLESIGEFVQRV